MRERSKLPTVEPQMEASTSKKGFECCMMCMRICFETHGDEGQAEAKELLAAPSFIKVIIDSHLSKFLRVPVMFMEDHGYRIGDMVTLRGPMGYECQAPLVYDKGYGFRTGCTSFLAYHDVEPGDYLLFTLIANSDFLIKVYNKFGCEKTIFPAIPYATNHEGKAQTKVIQERGSISLNADFNHNRKHNKDAFHEKRLNGISKSTVQCKARRKRKYKEDEDAFNRQRMKRCKDAVEVHDRKETRHHKGDADVGVKKGTKRLTRKPVMENASNEDCHEKNNFMEERKKQRIRLLFMLKRTISRFPKSVRANLDVEQGPEDSSEQLENWRGRVSATDQPDSIKWVHAQHLHANLEAPNGHEKRDTPTEHPVGSVTNFQGGCTPEFEEFAEGENLELNTIPGLQSPVCSEHKKSAYSVTLASDYHDFPGENEQHAAGDSARTSKEAQQEPMDIDTAENNCTTKVRQVLTLENDLISVPDPNKGKILQEASKELLEAADSLKTNNPSTRLFIRRTTATNTFTSFPASFSSKWFPKSKANVTLTNRAGKQWPVAWNPGNKKSCLTGGWRTFASENSLKEGDVCVLELINPCKLELLVHIFRSRDFPHEIGSQGGDRGGTKVVEQITPQAMKQGELAENGWRSEGDIEANQRTNSNRRKVAEHMTSSDNGRFKHCSEDRRMISKVDTQMFLPTAAQFFAGMKQLVVPGAEGKVVGDGSTREENDSKFSRRKERVTATLRTSARVRTEGALVTKQKSMGNVTSNVLDAANAMQLKNPHVAVVMRASHVVNGFTVFLPVSLPMPWRTTTLTLLDTAGNSCQATWVVTSGGKRLSAGWRRFAIDHKLAVGDVCIFEVTNFDNLTLLVHVFRAKNDGKCNGLSREVPRRGKRLSVDQRMQLRPVVAKSGKNGVAFVSQRRPVTRAERERAKQAAGALKSKNPTAVVVMPHSSVYQYFLVSIPMKFAKKWLPRSLVKVSLQDNTGQSWTATWAGNAKRTPCLKGWRAFSLDHCLEEGDVCVFELTNSTELIFNVHIFRVVAPNIRGSEAYSWHNHYPSISTNSPGHSKYHLQVRKNKRSQPANNPQNSRRVEDMVYKVGEAEVLPIRCPKNRLFKVIQAAIRRRLVERRAINGRREAQPDKATTEAMAGETEALAGPNNLHRSSEISRDFLQRENEPVILKTVKSELVVDSFETNTTYQVFTHEPVYERHFPSPSLQRESQFSPPLIDSLLDLQPCMDPPSRSDILLPLRSGTEFSSMVDTLPVLGPSVESSDAAVFHRQQLLAGCNRASPGGDIPQIRRDSPSNLKAPKSEVLIEANASDACPLGPQLLDSVMGAFSGTSAPWQKEITEVGEDNGGSVREDIEMETEGSEREGAAREMHLSFFSDVSAKIEPGEDSDEADARPLRPEISLHLKDNPSLGDTSDSGKLQTQGQRSFSPSLEIIVKHQQASSALLSGHTPGPQMVTVKKEIDLLNEDIEVHVAGPNWWSAEPRSQRDRFLNVGTEYPQ